MKIINWVTAMQTVVTAVDDGVRWELTQAIQTLLKPNRRLSKKNLRSRVKYACGKGKLAITNQGGKEYVSRSLFLAWAADNGLNVPPDLLATIKRERRHSTHINLGLVDAVQTRITSQLPQNAPEVDRLLAENWSLRYENRQNRETIDRLKAENDQQCAALTKYEQQRQGYRKGASNAADIKREKYQPQVEEYHRYREQGYTEAAALKKVQWNPDRRQTIKRLARKDGVS